MGEEIQRNVQDKLASLETGSWGCSQGIGKQVIGSPAEG